MDRHRLVESGPFTTNEMRFKNADSRIRVAKGASRWRQVARPSSPERDGVTCRGMRRSQCETKRRRYYAASENRYESQRSQLPWLCFYRGGVRGVTATLRAVLTGRSVTVTRDDIFALSLNEFVLEAVKQNESTPRGDSWRSPLWVFTRWMKTRREFTRCDGYGVAVLVQSVLARYTPEGDDPWEHYFGHLDSVDDPRAEFIDTWDKVKTPANMDALTVASQEAQRLPLRPKRSYSHKYCELLSLAGHLQRGRPEQVIALPVERTAEMLNCDRKSVTRYLKFAVKEKLLTRTSECVPHQRAAEFRFACERFDWTSGQEVK